MSVIENLDVYVKGTVGARVVSNTQLLLGSKVLAVTIGFVTLIVAAHGLGKMELGIVLFTHGFMLLFSKLATFQSWRAIIRFGAIDLRKKDATGLAGLIRFCIALDLLSALAAFLTAIGLLGAIGYLYAVFPDFGDKVNVLDLQQVSTYIYGYCLLILVSQQGTSIGIFRLFNRFDFLAARGLIMPVVRLTGALIAFRLDSGIEGYLLAWFAGSLLSKLALPIAAVFELRKRNLTRKIFSKWPCIRLKRDGLWPFVWKSNIDSTIAAGMTHLPLILVGPLLGAGYVAIFKIAEEIANLLSKAIMLVDQVIYPELARMINKGEFSGVWKIVGKSSLVLMLSGLVLALLVAIAGPSVISAGYGIEYGGVIELSILLILAAAINGIAAPVYTGFYATLRPDAVIMARLSGVAAYLASLAIFCAWFGSTGPGWAAIFGGAVSVGIALLFVKSILNRNTPSHPELGPVDA